MVCTNPNGDDGRYFILHNREPLFLAEIFEFDINDEQSQMECKRNFNLGSALEHDKSYFVFGVHWCSDNNLSADKLAGLFRRMADWYKSVLLNE